ncbi:putative TPR repeat-containing protein [Verrucomicrobia bacterium]|nr:putative TPR repeat-containing protein [Verrucomicrobiota bacterium]
MSAIASYASRLRGCGIGIRSRRGRQRLPLIHRGLLTFALGVLSGAWAGHAAETNAPPPGPSLIEATNFQQLLGACLQIQEQLQATRLALEQNRQEAKQAATGSTEAFSKGLMDMQEALSAQRTREFEALQRSNNTMVIVAGTFAGVVFLAMLITTYFQWRASNSLAGISTGLPVNRGLGPARKVAALGPGPGGLAPGNSTEAFNSPLLGALEQLDQHLQEFKRAISTGVNNEVAGGPNGGSGAAGSRPSKASDHARISPLFKRAHSLMTSGNPEAALACFDEVLALEPNHAEALVKRGAALERLHKLDEAIECYDRAIAADSSLTSAYLYKGGLYNRLERFKEALQCYEMALRTHDQRATEAGSSSALRPPP